MIKESAISTIADKNSNNRNINSDKKSMNRKESRGFREDNMFAESI